MAIVAVFTVVLAITVRLASCQADPGLAWIWPPPIGINLTSANVAPCGGFDTVSDNLVYFLDQLRWNQTASQITYMTRVTRNLNASGDWDELYPTIEAAVDQSNAKANSPFCVPITENSSLNETKIFQLIANTPAGIVFAVRISDYCIVAIHSYLLVLKGQIRECRRPSLWNHLRSFDTREFYSS